MTDHLMEIQSALGEIKGAMSQIIKGQERLFQASDEFAGTAATLEERHKGYEQRLNKVETMVGTHEVHVQQKAGADKRTSIEAGVVAAVVTAFFEVGKLVLETFNHK